MSEFFAGQTVYFINERNAVSGDMFSFGRALVWGVSGDGLPIAVRTSITLLIGDAFAPHLTTFFTDLSEALRAYMGLLEAQNCAMEDKIRANNERIDEAARMLIHA